MTLRPLGFDFPATAPEQDGIRLSGRRPETIDRDEQLAELGDELSHRRAAYPEMIRKGLIQRADADLHVTILAAIRDEVAVRAAAAETPGAPIGPTLAEIEARVAACTVSWDEKIRELRRELALRRNMWGKRVAKGLMSAAEARRRMERLEAVHWSYWMRLDGYERELQGLPADVARDHLRELQARRDAWARAGTACPPDEIEATVPVDGAAEPITLRHRLPGPFHVRTDAAGSMVLNAEGQRGLYAMHADLARRRTDQDAATIAADAQAIAQILSIVARSATRAAAAQLREAA
ncbi:hypothetical protein [Sphingomonas jatrophae]|uniref:Uncharacterized protein n=1 Tax=Sphingomonas jatrophae TaxID=1166337 RepID=A0A1I6K6T7_9SPHN|nr:hypothetical protein [Sphingomonas jatrophae]SFR86864.1 hypothetical protein SAMN05192580_1383 [Sphingomonas jatrophae]